MLNPRLTSSTALLLFLAPLAAAAAQEGSMAPPAYVVWKHMNGTLALKTSEVRSVWFRPAADGNASQVRVNSPSLVEPKTLSGGEAEELWKAFHDGAYAPLFVFVPHMGGTLAIPREQIRTLFFSEDGGAAKLRIGYDGDPSGKDLAGEDALRVWRELAP